MIVANNEGSAPIAGVYIYIHLLIECDFILWMWHCSWQTFCELSRVSGSIGHWIGLVKEGLDL